MAPKLRRTAGFWLRLLLVLQVAGLFTHAAAWGASKSRAAETQLGALSQILGHDVAICHHGAGDRNAPAPGSPDDCCVGGLCHCVSQTFDAPTSFGSLAPPVATRVGVIELPGPTALGRSPRFGATSARGPPLSV